MTTLRLATVLTCLFATLLITGCGGSNGQRLTQCGNGRIDDGEQCDDGNTVDIDACTGVCRAARCGDGAIQSGVEMCDGLNLGGGTCEALGYANGAEGRPEPGCTASCASFDVALCGPRFTPTPVRTATATPTATPTPPLTDCGNGLLEPGETCTSCPADCEPAACTPSGTTVTFALALTGGRVPNQASIALAYRTSALSIPGTGNQPSVRQRVRAAPPLPTSFTVTDLDYAVDVVSVRSAGLPSPFATARFDVCSGAPAPTVEDLSCRVTTCRDDAGVIADCRCTATVQP